MKFGYNAGNPGTQYAFLDRFVAISVLLARLVVGRWHRALPPHRHSLSLDHQPKTSFYEQRLVTKSACARSTVFHWTSPAKEAFLVDDRMAGPCHMWAPTASTGRPAGRFGPYGPGEPEIFLQGTAPLEHCGSEQATTPMDRMVDWFRERL